MPGLNQTNDTLTKYTWGGISTPFWFYADYSVIYDILMRENSQYEICIHHEYSDPLNSGNISSAFLLNMGSVVKAFYEEIFSKANQGE